MSLITAPMRRRARTARKSLRIGLTLAASVLLVTSISTTAAVAAPAAPTYATPKSGTISLAGANFTWAATQIDQTKNTAHIRICNSNIIDRAGTGSADGCLDFDTAFDEADKKTTVTSASSGTVSGSAVGLNNVMVFDGLDKPMHPVKNNNSVTTQNVSTGALYSDEMMFDTADVSAAGITFEKFSIGNGAFYATYYREPAVTLYQFYMARDLSSDNKAQGYNMIAISSKDGAAEFAEAEALFNTLKMAYNEGTNANNTLKWAVGVTVVLAVGGLIVGAGAAWGAATAFKFCVIGGSTALGGAVGAIGSGLSAAPAYDASQRKFTELMERASRQYFRLYDADYPIVKQPGVSNPF